jgi:predicted HNH restriction endonuclease
MIMANATDNLVEAEKIIKDIMVGRVVTDKALEICQWLLSFNSQENHKIKCYQTGGKRPDIRFCIDRGSDCERTKIMTGFAVIETDHALMGLYSSSPHRYTYFRPDTNKRWRIGSRDVTELPITTIREYILESYCLKIKDLGLDSVLCRGIDNINMKGEMKENNRNKGTVAVAPPWPTDKNWPDIVHTHNKAVNDRHTTVPETLSGAKSITLVIVCAAVEEPIPLCYLLNNKRKKLFSHLYYVKKYLEAIRAGIPQQDYEDYAKTINKDVAHFANVLKIDIQAVNDGLERALTLGKILGEKIGATVTSDIESLKAEEGGEEYFEGGKRKCLVNLYERNPKLRADAISFHGNKCKVCAFDFERFYGERGCNYIEVHHLRPVSSLNGKEKVNPASDMTVLCSNCHRMIHRSRDNVLSPEGLKKLINRQ